jgi:hypothetical protein
MMMRDTHKILQGRGIKSQCAPTKFEEKVHRCVEQSQLV